MGLQSPVVEDPRNEPCLFHSYASCLKGDRCEYSHLIHADQIQAPEPQTRRGHARLRIKRRLAYRLNTTDLYSVHHELQQEACKDAYAKDCTKSLKCGRSLGWNGQRTRKNEVMVHYQDYSIFRRTLHGGNGLGLPFKHVSEILLENGQGEGTDCQNEMLGF